MKSTTIASEQTNLFYVRLKTSPTSDWYIDAFDPNNRKINKKPLPKLIRKHEFLIDQIGFFHKHSWVHFNNHELSGWLPFKSIRNNYRRLAVPVLRQPRGDAKKSYLVAVEMMLGYHLNREQTHHAFETMVQWPATEMEPALFATVVVDTLGSFRNLSDKSLQRIRNQLRRQRPVVLWGSTQYRPYSSAIVLVGFNKHLFFYNDPFSGALLTISKQQLMKYWRSGQYQALSY